MKNQLTQLGIYSNGFIHHNLKPDALIDFSVNREGAKISRRGALAVMNGKFTGRVPKNRFFVLDGECDHKIHWNKHNLSIEEKVFDQLYEKITKHLSEKDVLFVFDGKAGASEKHHLKVRVVNEKAYQNLVARNMFIRLKEEEKKDFTPDFTVIAAPDCIAEGEGGIKDEPFVMVHLKKKIVIIGGTGYSGEIKKSIFTIMNYLLPNEGVLPMHCSANMYKGGDVALFFGLSGTGKTTLSTDVNRNLIGDDEHGWDEDGIFNFEGGCYAKTFNLNPAYEPQIYAAICHGSVVENVPMNEKGIFDYACDKITQNGRVAYPIEFIENAELSGKGGHPKTVLFLTADAFGVLPPVSKLNLEQAMYHFISGYTSKTPGTESGIIEPEATFSPFFGAPFMPHKPMIYANLLKEYLVKHNTNVFLINTGWTGGGYGAGKRMRLDLTRSIVNDALKGKLDDVNYEMHPIFNLMIPTECPNIPTSILNPINTWIDKQKYVKQANKLARKFEENINSFPEVSDEIKKVGPAPKEIEY